MRSSLESGPLRKILIAYTVNRLGTWIGLVALTIAVFDQTGSALAVAALLIAGQVIPALAVPALVARVEASRRGGELTRLYLFEAVATGVLAVLISNFSLPAILLLVMLDGTAALAASALLRAEVARAAREPVGATEPDRLPSGSGPPADAVEADSAQDQAERTANAALNTAFSVTFVLGPAMSGIIVAAFGPSAALLIDAASFLVSGALLLGIRSHAEETTGDSVRARLRAAWRHINDTPSLRALLLIDAVAWIFFETGMPIQVAYAKTTLHAGDRGFGLLLTIWGAGAVIGSVIFARALSRPLGYLLSFGTLAVGVGYMGFSAAPSLLAAGIAALAGGIGNGIELPSLFSIVQQLTPKNLHGRLMGAVESLSALCPAIGLPLGGALVVLTSPRTAFLVVGVGIIASAVALLFVAPLGRPRADRAQSDDAAIVAREPAEQATH